MIRAITEQLQIEEVAEYSAYAREEVQLEIRRGDGAVDRLVGDRLTGVIDQLAAKIDTLGVNVGGTQQYIDDVNDLRTKLALASAASDEPDIDSDSESFARDAALASDASSSAASSTPADKFFGLTEAYAKVVNEDLLPLLGADVSGQQRNALGAKLDSLGTAIGQLAQNTELSGEHREYLNQLLKDEIPGYKAALGTDEPPSAPLRPARERQPDSSQAPSSSAARRIGATADAGAILVTGAVRENVATVRQDFDAFDHNVRAFVAAFDVRLEGGIEDLYKLGQTSSDLLESAAAIQSDVNTFLEAGDEKTSKTAIIERARATIAIKQQELGAALSNLIE